MTKQLIGKFIIFTIFMTTFWFSSKPADVSSGQSQGVLVKVRIITKEDIIHRTPKYRFWRHHIRKMAHFGLYAIAGIGAFLATGDIKKSILIVFVMGSIDEFHQYFIPGRGAQVSDVLLDTFGGTTGALFTKVIETILTRKNKSFRKKPRFS